MKLTAGQHTITHASQIRADTIRALILSVLMGVCGYLWGWRVFQPPPWIEARYWDFGVHLCGGRIAAAAPLADNYFLFRCGDGSERMERVLLTQDWKEL